MRHLLFICLLGLPACLDGGDELEKPKAESSETVVFAIAQRTEAASGKTVTTAGHEYLPSESATGSGWATERQSWPDGWCRRFATPKERARRQWPGEGRARFAGGRLGDGQIVLDANGADSTFEGAAFEPGRPIVLDVERGFGIPEFEPVEVPAPNTSLAVRVPASEGAERGERRPLDIRADGGDAFRVEWSPRENADASVMIAFDTDDRSDHIRCFVREREGAAVVRADHFRGMRAGTLTIASHRAARVKPADGWLVEIVSMVAAFEQRFVVR